MNRWNFRVNIILFMPHWASKRCIKHFPSCDFHSGRWNGQLDVYYAVNGAFEDLQRCATTRWLTTAFNRCIITLRCGLTMFWVFTVISLQQCLRWNYRYYVREMKPMFIVIIMVIGFITSKFSHGSAIFNCEYLKMKALNLWLSASVFVSYVSWLICFKHCLYEFNLHFNYIL